MVLDYRDRCAHSTPGVAERTGAGAEPSHERRLRNSPRLSRFTHMTNNLTPDKGKGRWPNAVQDTTGRKAWRVPVSDSRRRR